MDKFEIRRLNLKTALRTHCQGKAAALADKIGRSASYVSRMLYPEGKAGKKRIGEEMRDLIENTLNLSHGALDDVHSAIEENGGKLETESDHTVAAKPSAASRALADVSHGETTLERLDASEKRIIELFRRANKDGKMIILGAATVAPKEDESGAVGGTD